MLKVTKVSLWEGRNVWGREYEFVQDGFHEAHHPPMKIIRMGPECCDKCLSKCPEFRMKIEGGSVKRYDIDFNITQVCVALGSKAKTTPKVLRKTVSTQVPKISEKEEKQQITPMITKIGPYAIKKTGVQRLLTNAKWSLKSIRMGMQVNASAVWPECAPFLKILS